MPMWCWYKTQAALVAERCTASSTLTKTSLPATPEFGTCSDIIRVTSELKSAVTVEMVGFRGPIESAADRGKTGMAKTVFRYAAGLVTEKG